MSVESALKLANDSESPAKELKTEEKLAKALAELAEMKALGRAQQRPILLSQAEEEQQEAMACAGALRDFFDAVAAEPELAFVKTWVAQALWNSMGSFGTMKEKQLATALRRQHRSDSVDLQGISQQFGLEIPQNAVRGAEDRVATISEELAFALALRTACAAYYLAATGEEPRPFARTGAPGAQPDPNLPAVGRPERRSRFS
jgi:hypothetical protein